MGAKLIAAQITAIIPIDVAPDKKFFWDRIVNIYFLIHQF